MVPDFRHHGATNAQIFHLYQMGKLCSPPITHNDIIQPTIKFKMPESIKTRLQEDIKTAMKARARQQLSATRLIMSAIKQREVDERIELDDTQVIEVLSRMLKQRRDSHTQYIKAERQDLADQEAFEIDLIQDYLPAPFDEARIASLIDEAITSTGATSARDIGKVMAVIKPQVQGRANMADISADIKARLQV